MSNLNNICHEMLKEVNEALAFCVVDVSSGLMLAVAHNAPYLTQSDMDTLAAASVDMFRGRTVLAVEQLLARHHGHETRHLIQELQMTTEKTFHFMSIVPGKPQCLAILITSKKANLGMGWVSLRRVLNDVAPLCP